VQQSCFAVVHSLLTPASKPQVQLLGLQRRLTMPRRVSYSPTSRLFWPIQVVAPSNRCKLLCSSSPLWLLFWNVIQPLALAPHDNHYVSPLLLVQDQGATRWFGPIEAIGNPVSIHNVCSRSKSRYSSACMPVNLSARWFLISPRARSPGVL